MLFSVSLIAGSFSSDHLQVPGEIYEGWGGNKNIVCLLDSVSLYLGTFSLCYSCICSWDCPSYVAKGSVPWQAVLLCACIWHYYTWGCSACHLLTLWVQFYGGQHFFELPVLQLRTVLSSLSLASARDCLKQGLLVVFFSPVASRVTDKSTEMVTWSISSPQLNTAACCDSNTGTGQAFGVVWMCMI